MSRTLISKVLIPGGLTIALFAFGSLASAQNKQTSAFSSAPALRNQLVRGGSPVLRPEVQTVSNRHKGAALQPLIPDSLALLSRPTSSQSTQLMGGCSCSLCRRVSVGLASKPSFFTGAQIPTQNAPISVSETSLY